MRPAVSALMVVGGLAFTALGLVSCSSDVSRFDYPMFASSEGQADASLTTSSVNPVPAEPVYQAPTDQTVVKKDLPPPSPAGQSYAARQSTYPQTTSQPSGARQQPPYRQTAAATPRVAAAPPPPKAAPVPAPAPKPKQLTIAVKRGDTLAALGRKYGTTAKEIMDANDLPNTRLSIGQKLVIPGTEVPAKVAASPTTYKVRSGDSLSTIADKYGIEYRDLARHNNLRTNAVLQLGQVLKIPARADGQTKPVRVASRGASVPLPDANPTRVAAPKKRRQVAARKPAPKSRPVKKASLPVPQPMSGNQFRWPVRGRVISGFGSKPNGKHNDGINVAVPLGASVKAAENGVVAYAGSELEGYGNLILVRHANGWVSAYAHNDEILVKRGDEVRRGQIIAKAGKTGSVSQPQVHFELRKGSQPVDPLKHMARS